MPELSSRQTPISENSPTVWVDVELGKRYQDVSFDYEAFEKEAGRREMDADVSSDLFISLYDQNPLSASRGSYIRDKNWIKVGVHSQKSSNKYLSHELQHAVDWNSGDAKAYGSNLRYSFRRPITAPLLTLMAYEDIRAITLMPSHADEIFDSFGPTRIGMFSLIAAYMWSYQYHPRERSARRAARKHSPQIISLTKAEKQAT